MWKPATVIVLACLTGCDESAPAPSTPPDAAVPSAPGPEGRDGEAMFGHVHRSQAGEADATGWFRATSTPGGFTVKLPAKFEDFQMRLDGEDGRPAHLYGLSTMFEGVQYSATATRRVDGSSADPRIIGELIEAVRAAGGLKSAEPVKVAGHDGFDVAASDGNVSTRMRAVTIGPTVYQLVVEGAAKQVDAAAARIAVFFNSFEPAVSPGQ